MIDCLYAASLTMTAIRRNVCYLLRVEQGAKQVENPTFSVFSIFNSRLQPTDVGWPFFQTPKWVNFYLAANPQTATHQINSELPKSISTFIINTNNIRGNYWTYVSVLILVRYSLKYHHSRQLYNFGQCAWKNKQTNSILLPGQSKVCRTVE